MPAGPHRLRRRSSVSLLGDVGRFLSAPVRGVRELAENLWRALRSLWLKVADLARHLADAFAYAWRLARQLARKIGSVARRVWAILRRLVTETIPNAARWALRKAVSFAKRASLVAQRFARTIVAKVVRWIVRRINTVVDFFTKRVRGIWRTLSSAWRWIVRTGRRLADIVLHPKRLVRWILGDLVGPLLRFLVDRAEGIGEWLFRLWLRNVLRFVGIAERVVARVL